MLLSACGSSDAALKAQIKEYDATINQTYLTAYNNYAVQMRAGKLAEAFGSIPQFLEVQQRASAFWTPLIVPTELEGYKQQILRSFNDRMEIEQRYAEYRGGYGSIVKALFPDGSVPVPAPR